MAGEWSDTDLCYYWLSTLNLANYNSGSAQPSLDRNYIYGMPVRVPEPDEQRAIANILGTLDDTAFYIKPLVFHIPSRPRGTAYHLDGAYLMRSGRSLVPMSEDQLRRIFAEGQPDWLEECSKTGLDTQEVVELLDTQTFFELLELPYPTDPPGCHRPAGARAPS